MGMSPTTDNKGNPRTVYFDRIAAMSDDDLFAETKSKIWLSAYANNNPRSDYHWQVDATYDEWKKRDRLDKYKLAYDQTVAEST